jgi:hypothetical protein
MPDGDLGRWISYQELEELHDAARVRGEIGNQNELKLAAEATHCASFRVSGRWSGR